MLFDMLVTLVVFGNDFRPSFLSAKFRHQFDKTIGSFYFKSVLMCFTFYCLLAYHSYCLVCYSGGFLRCSLITHLR